MFSIMDRSLLVLVCTFLLSPVLAIDMDAQCLNGIQTALDAFVFSEDPMLDYYTLMCTTEVKVNSMWAAAKTYCSPKEIEVGSELAAFYCLEYGLIELIPYDQVLPILTDDYLASLQVVGLDDADLGLVMNETVLISPDLYTLGYKTTYTYEHQYYLHKAYGWGVLGFWGILLLVGMGNRLTTHILDSKRRRLAIDIEGEGTGPSSAASSSRLLSPFKFAHHWIRSNLIIPAAFNSHHQRLYMWCTIPTRMEVVILALFYALNIVLCAISYEVFDNNLYYENHIQAWRYISDRTGIISYANLPLVWMFSGRNNVFLWLTGWSFSSFNIFHRHIARIATIQAIVHSIGWSYIQAYYGYFAESWAQEYWYMGGMATVTMSLLLVFSSVWLRMRHYEIFLLIHIALSVLTIVGLFYHTAIFTSREYDGYLWPLVAIWLVDRFARLGRLAYINHRVKKSDVALQPSRVTVTYNKAADMIRIEALTRSRRLRPGPGQHYYIYQYNRLLFWENHPFTLAAWYSGNHKDDFTPLNPPITSTQPDIVVLNDKSETEVISEDRSSGNCSSPEASSLSSKDIETEKLLAPEGHDKVVFFVRPFNGWTKRLRDECSKSGPQGLTSAKILLEGPYGERSPLASYENVIFVVGGTGIAGAIPYLQEHMRLSARNQCADSQVRDTRIHEITVVWAARQAAMIEDVVNHELEPFLHHDNIKFSFHATRESKMAVAASPETLKVTGTAPTGIDISNQRPDIQQAVNDVVERVNAAGSKGGRIAILTCGPAAMADEARAAAHKALKAGMVGIEYIEEAFGW